MKQLSVSAIVAILLLLAWTPNLQAEWIEKTREEFPEMDIQCGIWKDRVDRVTLLLKAGADSISKFPAVKKFGSEEAKAIEDGARRAMREFEGTLTKMPDVDWDAEVDGLELDDELREKVRKKLKQYLKTMEKSSD